MQKGFHKIIAVRWIRRCSCRVRCSSGAPVRRVFRYAFVRVVKSFVCRGEMPCKCQNEPEHAERERRFKRENDLGKS